MTDEGAGQHLDLHIHEWRDTEVSRLKESFEEKKRIASKAPSHHRHHYDPDDKYGKAYYQRNRAFYGYCSKESAGIILAGLLVLVFSIGVIIIGVGYQNLPGLEKPPPDDDEDGGDGLDLSGIGNSAAARLVVDNDKTCPAGQDLVGEECVRKFLYPMPLDSSMMKESVEPCDDFYDYACGTFAEDERNIGQDASFSYLYAENARVVQSSITEAPDTTQLGRFYKTCVEHDEEPFDISRYTILPKLLEEVQSFTSIEEVMAELMKWDVLLPFRFSLELNPLDTRHATPTFIRAGLTDEPQFIGGPHHLAYIMRRFQFVVNELKWSPVSVQHNANLVVEVERHLAQGWPNEREEQEDLVAYIEKMRGPQHQDLFPYKEFKSMMEPAFDVGKFLHHFDEAYFPFADKPFGAAEDTTTVWVFKENYFRSLARSFTQLSTEHWKAYLIHSILFSVIDPIPSHTPELYYIYHHGYNAEHALPWKRRDRFTTHDSLSVNREQRCVQITAAYLPIILDEYFVEDMVSMSSTRRQVKHMMQSIKEDLARQLRENGEVWESAAKKVLSIDVMAGTPDNWPIDRSSLIIDTDSHADNILRVRRFHQELMVRSMCTCCVNENAPHTITPEVLFDYPLYWVNAYYQHQLDTIVINAGILKPPIFSNHYEELGQMARLGVIVGHETGHSIDMTGSLFDDTGAFFSWLTEDTEERYEDNAQCFVDLYTERTKYGNIHNGEMTLNENIADIVGFRTAFNVMFHGTDPNDKAIRERKRQFFLIYAQTWCQATTAEKERQFIEQSVHSTSRMRVNKVVSQVPDFYDVFGCQNTRAPQCNMFRSLLSRKKRSTVP